MVQALGSEGERNASAALCTTTSLHDAIALALNFVADEV